MMNADNQTVLLVDGDETRAETTLSRFAMLDYRVQHEASAEAALACIQLTPPGRLKLNRMTPLDGQLSIDRLASISFPSEGEGYPVWVL